MTTGGITVDTTNFQRALAGYAVATNKSLKDTANRAVRNLAFKGLALTREAEAGAIRSLQLKSWWPKYIAKILFEKKLAGILSKQARQISAGKKIRYTAAHYTRAQARAFSNKLIKRRLVAVRFLKFFWLSIGNSGVYKGARKSIGKTFGGFSLIVKPATDKNPNCEVITRYSYKRRSEITAKKTEALLSSVIPAAYAQAAKDMNQYASDLMNKDARKFSARGAA